MKRLLLLFTWLLPIAVMAQYKVAGRVIDKETQKPIPNASVFLSNASVGSSTANDGTFALNGVRGGQYDMVVSFVGYAPYRQTILVNNDMVLPDIELSIQAIQMKAVRIMGIDKHWAEHYATFVRLFMGQSDNARYCEIMNPHALDFDNNRETGEFSANASGDLQIENRALGYKIRYTLNSFTNNSKTGQLYFEGEAFFEDMKGGKGKLKRWKQKRQEVYLGSSMHFLRMLIANKVDSAGFTVRRLIRKPNPAWKGGLNNKYLETLVTTPLVQAQYYHYTDKPGVFAISFEDFLYITYGKNSIETSIIDIDGPYAFFDNNGIILNPQRVIMEGTWGDSRMAELLPVDYEP